jgi:N-dimethylarginine dimethylaminohydrolase
MTKMELRHHSEVGRLTHVLLKRPEAAFLSQAHLNKSWEEYGYLGCPDYELAVEEYSAFEDLLRATVPNISCLGEDPPAGLDSLYVRDALLMTDRGAVVLNMGKTQRRAEPKAAGGSLPGIGIPVLGEIRAPGCVEGGDVVWFDRGTLAVGLGYRTNAEGIRQLRNLLADFVNEIVVVPLPHWKGPGDVLHLMSLISPLDFDLSLVFSPLLPVSFREWLIDRSIKLLEVPEQEFPSMGGNVLAVAPRDVIMLSGNPRTRGELEAAGVTVREYAGSQISQLGSGGPTCLTRPLCRLNG